MFPGQAWQITAASASQPAARFLYLSNQAAHVSRVQFTKRHCNRRVHVTKMRAHAQFDWSGTITRRSEPGTSLLPCGAVGPHMLLMT